MHSVFIDHPGITVTRHQQQNVVRDPSARSTRCAHRTEAGLHALLRLQHPLTKGPDHAALEVQFKNSNRQLKRRSWISAPTAALHTTLILPWPRGAYSDRQHTMPAPLAKVLPSALPQSCRTVGTTSTKRLAKVLPTAPPAPLDAPLIPKAKGAEAQAFMLSDLAFRLCASRAPAVVWDLALSYRGTPLHHACYHNRIDDVNRYLNCGASPTSTTHPYGMSPLHLAALRGHAGIVRRLLEAGAQPTMRDRCRKRTAARWARARGHVALAEALAAYRPGKPFCDHV